ncbi:hypothetical protein [Streptomyces antibioticus]|uniref:Uncharacterized protein n=1 Tax=Streptomyces antibioticus TaxID=1890 RepID=A0AAE6YDJ7_STRAT|nr:hypothetical protein [Streptomyces antibioticus]OOQ47264.1 hypothetical protein AFM16_31440 [Streptomyces antibioticus]QIT47581.1 hypothetical protein HCX60_31990 [Streptomyces antibioticus]
MALLSFLFADLTPASAVLFSVALFAASLVPFFLLVETDFAAVVRPAGAVVSHLVRVSRDFCRDAAALLILLTTSPKGAMA